MVLPDPDGPSMAKNSPGGDVEVDGVHGDDVVEDLGHPSESHRALGHAAPNLPRQWLDTRHAPGGVLGL